MKVSRKDLAWIGSGKTEQGDFRRKTASFRRASEGVRPELDLRGKMVEEAVYAIDRYLDQAILAGYREVYLIHGKGTGALRTGVQQFLRNHPNVKRFRLGGHGEGGSGVTVVELQCLRWPRGGLEMDHLPKILGSLALLFFLIGLIWFLRNAM